MQQRRLAAIMFTDIVGYTALMGESESTAFQTLHTNLEIHQKLTKKHHGKIVKELGDGLLMVFENGTEAVLCAVDIQKEAHEKGIPLRIGIHEGEVVFDNDDVFGDGVNIASRIQDEAAQGGICISDSVYRIIKNKRDIKTESIGVRHLKNVNETIKLYQIKAEGVSLYHHVTNWKKSKVKLWFMIITASLISILIGWFINEKTNKVPLAMAEKFDVFLPAKAPVVCKYGSLPIAISPDGSLIVYQAFVDNKMCLYKRYLNQYEAIPITGTEGGIHPFFSPDGEWVGFQSNGKLKKILLDGGRPEDICEVSLCSFGAWLPDNTIIFGVVGEGLKRISASGGTYSSLTSLDFNAGEWIQDHPHYLPDGNTILFSVMTGTTPLYIKSVNLRNQEEKVIINGGIYPMYSQSGHLIYVKDNNLMATPFSLKKLKPTGPAVVLIENVAFLNPSISLSNNGTLVYVPEQDLSLGELVWVNMNGVSKPIIDGMKSFWGPRISPDGNKIAMWITINSDEQVYIYDLVRESFNRLTNAGGNYWPVWTPDGKYVAFPSIRPGSEFVNIYWKPMDGSTPAEAMIRKETAEKMSDYFCQPQMWTSNGRYLLFVRGMIMGDSWDIMLMDMDNDNQVSEFIATEYDERHPRISPNGQWLAYQSKESGNYEIYVTNFPEKGARWQISAEGGIEPIWSPDGKRIYYRYYDQIMSVNIETASEFHAEKPEILFTGKFKQSPFGWYYDIHPDGDRFVMVKNPEIDSVLNQIFVIRNFSVEIESKFASNR